MKARKVAICQDAVAADVRRWDSSCSRKSAGLRRRLRRLECALAGGDESRHFDSKWNTHHDAPMRTTVTLDKDVERMVRDAMHRSRRSFKETLNAALRAGLSHDRVSTRRAPFIVKAKPMGLRTGIDPASLNQLADDMEVE